MASVAIAAWTRVLVQLGAVGLAYWETHGGLAGFDRTFEPADVTFKRAVIHWQRRRSTDLNDFEDLQIVTHWLNITDDAPDSTWTDADYATVEAAVETFWTAIKGGYQSNLGLNQIRWYNGTLSAGVVGDAERVHLYGATPTWFIAGTSSSTSGLPPQSANVVTLRCHPSGHWGRMYLPAPAGAGCDTYGRYTQHGVLSAAAANLVVNGHANGIAQVVYSRTQSALLTPYAVSVDNTFDTIRRRRYDSWTARTITPAPA